MAKIEVFLMNKTKTKNKIEKMKISVVGWEY